MIHRMPQHHAVPKLSEAQVAAGLYFVFYLSPSGALSLKYRTAHGAGDRGSVVEGM